MTDATASALQLLSVVIPARDEEGCIAATVEHPTSSCGSRT
jgi:hypothetical protein